MDIIDIDRIEKCYQEDFGVVVPAENVLPGKEYVDLCWEAAEAADRGSPLTTMEIIFISGTVKTHSPVEIIKLSYLLHISTTPIGSIPFKHNV